MPPAKKPARVIVKQMLAALRPFRHADQWWLTNPEAKMSPWGPYESRTEMLREQKILAEVYAGLHQAAKGEYGQGPTT